LRYVRQQYYSNLPSLTNLIQLHQLVNHLSARNKKLISCNNGEMK
jgi:hypothetical protein